MKCILWLFCLLSLTCNMKALGGGAQPQTITPKPVLPKLAPGQTWATAGGEVDGKIMAALCKKLIIMFPTPPYTPPPAPTGFAGMFYRPPPPPLTQSQLTAMAQKAAKASGTSRMEQFSNLISKIVEPFVNNAATENVDLQNDIDIVLLNSICTKGIALKAAGKAKTGAETQQGLATGAATRVKKLTYLAKCISYALGTSAEGARVIPVPPPPPTATGATGVAPASGGMFGGMFGGSTATPGTAPATGGMMGGMFP